MKYKTWEKKEIERLETLADSGSSIGLMSEELGRSKLSIANQLNRMKKLVPMQEEQGEEETEETPKSRRTTLEKAAINFLDMNLKDRDYTNVWSSILDFQGALDEKSIEQKSVHINIKTKKWIGIAFVGDLHIGNMATDYKAMLSHRDMIAKTDNLYVVLNGDYCDNYIPSSHVSGMFEALFPPAVQKNLAKDYITSIRSKVLALVAGCFMKGSPVTMADGTEKAIEEVQVGDYVLSGDGKGHRVTKTYENIHDGEVLKVYSEGNYEPLHVTWDHPVYVLKRDKVERNGKNKLKKTQFNMNNVELVDARELKEGDFLCSPIARSERKTPKRKFKNYKYELDIPFLRLAGYWLAEGSYRKYKGKPRGIEFSFGNKDSVIIKETENICKELGLNVNTRVIENKNVVSVYINDQELASMFYELFGEYSHGKFVHPIVLSQPALKLCHLLDAFGRGDGCLREQNGRWSMTMTTVSRKLSNALCYMLNKSGLPYSIRQQKRAEDRWDDYQINFGEDSIGYIKTMLETDSNDTPRRYAGLGTKIRVFSNMMWHRISKIESGQFKGKVYNVTVPDTSEVVVNKRLAHQCHDIWGMKAADFDLTEYLAKHGEAAYLGSGGTVFLKVGEMTYKVALRHKYRYNNADNPTATVKKMFEKCGGFDVGVVSHNHVACMEECIKEGMDGNKKRLFIRAGTYKIHDRYGKQLGFSEGDISVPVVLFNPRTRDIRGFQQLEEGIEYLAYLNSEKINVR